MVKAKDRVAADRGLIAIERGPLVYCDEGPVMNSSGAPYPTAENPNEGNGFFSAAGNGETTGLQSFENDFDIHSAVVPASAQISATPRPDKFNGIIELTLPVQAMTVGADGQVSLSDASLTLIPYYAWSHRGRSNMAVWHKTPARLFSE